MDWASAPSSAASRPDRRPVYPRFKGRGRLDTVEYTHPDGLPFFGTSLYVQHVGRVKAKQHRPVEGQIKAVSLTRKADGVARLRRV